MIRTASKKAIEFIASYEGFSPKACKCVPTEKYYTIGYGHYGADVKANQTITKEDALKLLANDVKTAEKFVNNMNTKGCYHFTQHEFDALVSFTYNCGGGTLGKLCDEGRRSMRVIREKIVLYNKSGGNTLKGLEKRRKDELEMMMQGDYNRD